MSSHLTLGELELDAYGYTDSYGVAWYWDALEGWDAPEQRGELVERPDEDGALDLPALYGPRPLSVHGYLIAPTMRARDAARDRLAGFTNLRTAYRQLVRDEDPARGPFVRRSGRLLMRDVSATATEFEIPLVAPRPAKLAAGEATLDLTLPAATGGGLTPPLTPPLTVGTSTTGGIVVATNAGNFPVAPVVRINGPVANPELENVTTEQTVRFALELAAGEFLEVDFDARSVLLGGTATRRSTMTGEWWRLEPGDNSVRFSAATFDAAASATLTFRSAWI